MDLLLTHGYFVREDPKELQIMRPYPPLGLLYICSHLRKQGFQVEVFDSTFSTRSDLFSCLQQGQPAILGIYANLMTRRTVIEILKFAAQAGWKTVVGGPEPGAYVEEYLDAGADVVVSGEGEITLEELIPALKQNSSDETLSRIAGIAFKTKSGTVCRTGAREQIKDLDQQPWPARDAIDSAQYLTAWRQHHGEGSVSLITARGCPYHCRWCSHQVFGKTHRRRKPADVADELEYLIATYSPDIGWIADDVFTIHHGWLSSYADELKKRRLKLPFECITRADRVNEHVAQLLANLGCFRVWIGSESGSQRILDAMERGVSVEQVRKSVELLRSAGIQTGMFLMWGYENEELADIEATIEHVKLTQPDIFFTTVAYPIKGTPYFEEVGSRIESVNTWATGSDREVRIRGRRSRHFYGVADKLLRAEVDLHRLRRSSSASDRSTILEREIEASRASLLAAAGETEA